MSGQKLDSDQHLTNARSYHPVATIYLLKTRHLDTFEASGWFDMHPNLPDARLAAVSKKRRVELLLSRFLLRYALTTQHPDLEPTNLTITERKSAPPSVSPASNPLSLSHSHDWIGVAISNGQHRVGLDIEYGRTDRDFVKTAKIFCNKNEIETLRGSEDDDATRNYFYRLWTRKEAVYKSLYPDNQKVTMSQIIASEGSIKRTSVTGWLDDCCISLASESENNSQPRLVEVHPDPSDNRLETVERSLTNPEHAALGLS